MRSGGARAVASTVPARLPSGFARQALEPEVLPQVHLSYALIINDFLRLPVGENRPVVDDVGPVANAESLSYIVIRDKDTNASTCFFT